MVEVALKDRVTPMVIQVGRVAAQEIHLEVLDRLILGAQAQQGREILEQLQIQEQVADSMLVVVVALALPEEQVRCKVTAATVMHG